MGLPPFHFTLPFHVKAQAGRPRLGKASPCAVKPGPVSVHSMRQHARHSTPKQRSFLH